MPKQIFVNLPVKDLKRSIAFFTRLGFSFDPKFTDDKATCMIIGENIFAMLLVEEFFQGFTRKEICNTKKCSEVIVALSFDSREEVDAMVKGAEEAGGSIPAKPADHGWMYQWTFLDLDGHRWEPLYMDPNANK